MISAQSVKSIGYDSESIAELSSKQIQPLLVPLAESQQRLFVILKDFQPFFVDVPKGLQPNHLAFIAYQQIYARLDLRVPASFSISQLLQFKTEALVFCEIIPPSQLKPIDRPLFSEPFGFDQDHMPATVPDQNDNSLFVEQQMPRTIYINQLVQLATDPSYIKKGSKRGYYIRAVFMYYYQAWLTADQLFEKLKERFFTPPPPRGGDVCTPQHFQVNVLLPIRLQVQFFYEWLTFYRDDISQMLKGKMLQFFQGFAGSFFDGYLQRLFELLNWEKPKLQTREFCKLIVAQTTTDQKMGAQWIKEFHEYKLQFPVFSLYLNRRAAPKIFAQCPLEFNEQVLATQIDLIPPSSKMPQLPTNHRLVSTDHKLLAATIHFFLYETYRNIHPREFIGCPQQKPDTLFKCPNVNLHIRRFNIVSHFVASTIFQTDASLRLKFMEKIIYTASELKEMKNYEGCMALISGCQLTPILRLKLWDQLDKDIKPRADQLRDLFGLGDNWQTYRRELGATSSADMCVPVSAITLKDVFMTEEGQGRNEKGKANFMRAALIWNTAHKFLRFQAAYYKGVNFNDKLYQELCQCRELSDDELWELSYKAVPKDQQQ